MRYNRKEKEFQWDMKAEEEDVRMEKEGEDKGSLQKKKPEIYWSFTNTGYPPPLPPLARIGNFRFFLRLFSRGGWS